MTHSLGMSMSRSGEKRDILKFAHVDGSLNPELVALLQVREYPSVRLVTEDGAYLRTFNRALLLSPTTLVYHLQNWKEKVAMWKGFGGVNEWSRVYAWQVRLFNGVWGGWQHWQVRVIECLREGRRMMTGALLGMIIGGMVLHRFGYLRSVF